MQEGGYGWQEHIALQQDMVSHWTNMGSNKRTLTVVQE